MTSGIHFATLTLLGSLLALAGCDDASKRDARPSLPAVTVAQPLQKVITEWDEYTGRFASVATVEVRARVSGFIDSIHFKDGQIVKQGDLLFIIDPRPYKLAVEQAKADVERARAKLEIANLDVERAAPLVRSQAVTAAVEMSQTANTKLRTSAAKSRKATGTGRMARSSVYRLLEE